MYQYKLPLFSSDFLLAKLVCLLYPYSRIANYTIVGSLSIVLQKNRRFKVLLNMILEALLIYISYRISIFVRFTVLDGTPNPVVSDSFTKIIIAFYSLCTVSLFYLFHLYIPMHQLRSGREFSLLILINIITLLALGMVLYLFRIADYSRIALGFFGLFSIAALCIKRIITRAVIHKRFEHNIGLQRVILIGSGDLAAQYWRDINDYPQYGRTVIGYIGDVPEAGMGPHLGSLNQIEDTLGIYDCDEVVVALEKEDAEYIQIALDTAGKEGLRISMIPLYHRYFPRHPTIESFGNSVLIDLRATPLDNLSLAAIKRTFDIVGSLLLLILLSPLMLITAIVIKLESPGPVFFRQQRVGLQKKEFTMLKFRSMRVNATSDTAWSTKTDSRRTRFGRFIRKYSIDELPQLFNVLMGSMSLVGPRPEVPFYVRQFKESVPLYLVRQQVRPGMTGWAQVHGLRGDTSIEARVKYDIWYIENWSLLLDIRILFLTLFGGFMNDES